MGRWWMSWIGQLSNSGKRQQTGQVNRRGEGWSQEISISLCPLILYLYVGKAHRRMCAG